MLNESIIGRLCPTKSSLSVIYYWCQNYATIILLLILFILSQLVTLKPISNGYVHNWLPPNSSPEQFEVVRPRLFAVYEHSIDKSNLPNLNIDIQQSIEDDRNMLPSRYMLTFVTNDQTIYHGIIYKQETVNGNQLEEIYSCTHYHGTLVTPIKGHLTVTTCPDYRSPTQMTMSSNLILESGQVIMIRPTISQSNDDAIKHERHRKRRNKPNDAPNTIQHDCYMSEYGKTKLSIEDHNLDNEGNLMMSSSNVIDAQIAFNEADQTNHLIYQFGPHFLTRLANMETVVGQAVNLEENADNMIGILPIRNYSHCMERYIEPVKKKIDEKMEDHYKISLNEENQQEVIVSEHRTLRRRDISRDDIYSKVYTIETVIFADDSLLARFDGNKRELQKLILAIMNEVQLIYNFDSLKIRIRILIKQIVYLEGKDVPDTADGDIDQYLDNFCAWQRRLWQKANKTARWDHALMLTGLDLYKKVGYKKNRKVLGLAWVNGMCRPAYSCTLNEGKNFEASFVIAHEMAHSLGMLHDGYDNNCDPEKYIMSEKTGPGKINWSPCSNLYLENFLTKSSMRCLETTRANQIKTFNDPFDENTDTRLPGEQYTLNQQCQLALGGGYKAYTSSKAPFQDVCRELWCSSGTWATPAHPALEGSSCGNRKSCYQGSCVDRQRAFAQSKIKMYNNRRSTSKPMKASSEDEYDRRHGANSSSRPGPTFMRRVQRFLKSTIGSVVKFFG